MGGQILKIARKIYTELATNNIDYFSTKDITTAASGQIHEKAADGIVFGKAEESPLLKLAVVKNAYFAVKIIKDIYDSETVTLPAKTYVVKSGDTLSKIATAHSTTISKLIEINKGITQANKNNISIGQKIVINKEKTTQSPKTGKVYTVKSGDSLNAIAKANKTTVAAIIKLNGDITQANKNNIRVGQKIKLYAASSKQKIEFKKIENASLGNEVYIVVETSGLDDKKVRININQGKAKGVVEKGQVIQVTQDDKETVLVEATVGEFVKNNLKIINKATFKNWAIAKVKLAPKTEQTLKTYQDKINELVDKTTKLYLLVDVHTENPDLDIEYFGNKEGGDAKDESGYKNCWLDRDGRWFVLSNGICIYEARVRAYMRMLRIGEGTEGESGYTKLFGGQNFTKAPHNKSMSDHPRIHRPFGKTTSTAAGAYQVMGYNWDDANMIKKRKKYGIEDFEPESQDLFCIILFKHKRKGMLQLIMDDKIEQATSKYGSYEWASLPPGRYGQPNKTMAQALKLYDKYLKEELAGKSDLQLKNGFLKKFGIDKCNDNKEATPTKNNDTVSWMEIAKGELGVKEIKGKKHNKRVLEYHSVSGGFSTDEVPWCGSFVNWVMKKDGHATVSIPARAKSWKNFGKKIATPVYGAIGVKSRSGGGHVAFVVGKSKDGNYLYMLGGNQHNEVNIRKYPKSVWEKFVVPNNYDTKGKTLPVYRKGAEKAGSEG